MIITMFKAPITAVLVLFFSSLGNANASDSWFLNWPFWSEESPHSLPSHVHVPPQKSVCDKMMSWMEILGHNNSYSCEPLPHDIHEVLPQFCSIAGLETFNNCRQNQEIEVCLKKSLQNVGDNSVTFNRCLCHGYVEKYAAMMTIWKMMCEDPDHYHGHSHPLVDAVEGSGQSQASGNSQVSPGQASSRYQPPDILQTSLGHGGSSNPPSALLRLDWPTLHREVTLRYFSPDKYYDSKDLREIWNDMGANITCTVSEDMRVSLDLPDDFKKDLPFKVYTHGLSHTVFEDVFEAFVGAWMNKYEKQVNVILVDWRNLASWTVQHYSYEHSSRNCIDVGVFVGMCLSGLSNRSSIPGANFHFVGHSLGSHTMGKAGRTFTANQHNSELVGRISGLDPAGPRFFDGPGDNPFDGPAIPELAENILSKESAAFVDVIHTNGASKPCAYCTTLKRRNGILRQLGHMDFYPDGGSVQTGCLLGPDAYPGGFCSHGRATKYFLHSIREPLLFPSVNCASVEECNQERAMTHQISGYMGEDAMNYWDGQSRSLFYHDIKYCHWTYYKYSNPWICLFTEDYENKN